MFHQPAIFRLELFGAFKRGMDLRNFENSLRWRIFIVFERPECPYRVRVRIDDYRRILAERSRHANKNRISAGWHLHAEDVDLVHPFPWRKLKHAYCEL